MAVGPQYDSTHVYVAPADLQSAYGLPSSSAGRGQTIGIAVAYDDPDLEADLGVYRAKFGLPACTTSNGCFAKIGLDDTASGYGGCPGPRDFVPRPNQRFLCEGGFATE